MPENKNEFETIDFSAENNEKNNVSNLFSDFNTDISMEKDLKEKKDKNMFYYLQISLKIFQITTWIFVFILILFLSYIFVQKSENIVDNHYLDPICFILNGEVPVLWWGCSSVTVNEKILDEEKNRIKEEYSKQVLWILPTVYETESFLNTKEVDFLVSKSKSKLKVLDILEKFDFYKSDFTWFDKKKIQCSEISIDWKNKILSMKCEAYAAWYTKIIWFSWDKTKEQDYVNWTSVSIANSFINFLEKNAKKYFLVIDRQKLFESEVLKWIDWYTNKTTFNLKLKINF